MITEKSSALSGSAIFVDIENIIGSCSTLGIPVYMKPICEKIKEIAPIRFRSSFGDISKACLSLNSPQQTLAVRKELSSNLFEIQDIPYVIGFKNSADVHIVTTALSMAFENDLISHFVFVTNDRDFIPLYKKLREKGKIVIAICTDEIKTSSSIIEAVDHLFYYERLLFPKVHEEKTAGEEAEFERSLLGADLKERYFNIALRACKILQDEKGIILGSALLPKMKQLQADIDLIAIGIYRFKDFLVLMQKKGYINFHGEGAGPIEIELLPMGFVEKASIPELNTNSKSLSIDELSSAYKLTLEQNIKVPFPSLNTRKAILNQIRPSITPYTTLTDVSNTVLKIVKYDCPVSLKDERIVYKTLLSLFFARAFNVEVDAANRHNPIVIGTTLSNDELFDKLSVNYTATLMKKNEFGEIMPDALSMLLFESLDDGYVRKCVAYIDEAKDILR